MRGCWLRGKKPGGGAGMGLRPFGNAGGKGGIGEKPEGGGGAKAPGNPGGGGGGSEDGIYVDGIGWAYGKD